MMIEKPITKEIKKQLAKIVNPNVNVLTPVDCGAIEFL